MAQITRSSDDLVLETEGSIGRVIVSTNGVVRGSVDASGNATGVFAGGGGGSVNSVSAADGSIVIGGTATNPTVKTGTLDAVATAHPPVAAVALNSQKITGLANGSAGTDGAAYGQTMASKVTTNGDLVYGTGAGALARIGIGTSNQVLTVSSGVPSWQNASSGFANPMTSVGDLIVGGTAGAAGRLAIGSTGQVLTVSGGTAAWAQGPVNLAYTALKTANYSASAADFVVCDNSGGSFTVTLPTTPANNTTIGVFIAKHASTNTTTVACGGSDVFNVASGATSYVMNTLNQVLILQYASSPAIWYMQVIPVGTMRQPKRTSATAGPGATPSMNTDNFDVFHFTALAAAITSMTTNLTGTPVDGDSLRISFTDNGTARAITWGASFEASTVALPTTTVISARLDVGFFYNTETSKWRCVAVA